MEVKYPNIFLSLMIVTCFLSSCGDAEQEKVANQTDTIFVSTDSFIVKPVATLKQVREHRMVCEFVAYNDDGDYYLMFVKDNNEEESFINDEIESRDLLRGDLIEVTWKQDTIYIAGDGGTPELANWALKVKKIKDGNVSLFRKKHPQSIRFLIFRDEDFTDWFKDRIYLLVEYYLANTQKEILLHTMEERFSNMIYTIEEQQKNGRAYYMIGIAVEFEHRLNTMQWLYVDSEDYRLYEYDLPNDKLILFE